MPYLGVNGPRLYHPQFAAIYFCFFELESLNSDHPRLRIIMWSKIIISTIISINLYMIHIKIFLIHKKKLIEHITYKDKFVTRGNLRPSNTFF